MRKEIYLSPKAGIAKHSRNSDIGSKRGVNKQRRRKIKKEIRIMKQQELKDNIGEDLYNQLSDEDRVFMLETAGSIDFGHPVDLEKVEEEIRKYKNGE